MRSEFRYPFASTPVNFIRPRGYCSGHANRSEASQVELSLTHLRYWKRKPNSILLDAGNEHRHRGILCKTNVSVLY
jgi:hypothetical protein